MTVIEPPVLKTFAPASASRSTATASSSMPNAPGFPTREVSMISRPSDQGAHSSSFVELLRRRALDQPERRAYTFLLDGETNEAHLSYAALDQQARAIAALLQRAQVSGERALLLYPPGLDYIAAF